jgi:hypothetical protein
MGQHLYRSQQIHPKHRRLFSERCYAINIHKTPIHADVLVLNATAPLLVGKDTRQVARAENLSKECDPTIDNPKRIL